MVKVVAKNYVKENEVENFLAVVKELVEKTVQEEGCITYELFQDVKDSAVLIFVEEWETMEALDNHMKSEHFTRIVPQLGELTTKEGEINVCQKLL